MSSSDGANELDQNRPADDFRRQRDAAFAFLLLAVAIAVSTLISNFCGDYKGLDEIRGLVALHKRMYVEELRAIDSNERALSETKHTLDLLPGRGAVAPIP